MNTKTTIKRASAFSDIGKTIGVASIIATAEATDTVASIFPEGAEQTQNIFSAPVERELSSEQKSLLQEVNFVPDGAETLQTLHLDAGLMLQLLQPPKFVWRNFTQPFIKGWEVRLPVEKLDLFNIKREMCRQFLRLQHHASLGTLLGKDKETWNYIVENIDYAKYCEDTALPLALQGRLVRRKGQEATVCWMNDESDINFISHDFLERFKFINEGEYFTCKVKFSGDSQIKDIFDITPTSFPETVDTSWIQAQA